MMVEKIKNHVVEKSRGCFLDYLYDLYSASDLYTEWTQHPIGTYKPIKAQTATFIDCTYPANT